MDGAGFVHTDPAPDADTVVGVAEIAAHDDYVNIASSGELRIDVLANDPLPRGAGSLKIKSVSAAAAGGTVSISEDGQRIVYTLPAESITFDSFYYIVESDDGKLGKANVTLQQPSPGGYYNPPVQPSQRFEVFEDAEEAMLNVLRGSALVNGEIMAVTAAQIGVVRISDDGKSLLYKPNFGESGRDRFEFTAQTPDGSRFICPVYIDVVKPFQIVDDGDGLDVPGYEHWPGIYARDVDTGPHAFDLMANDYVGPTPETPRIVEVDFPDYAGELVISDDGRSVTYVPAAGFLGRFDFSYTIQYGPFAHQRITGYEAVQVQNTFLAVENWFRVDSNSTENDLDVLANDPLLPRYDGVRRRLPDINLTLFSWSGGSHGGQVSLAADGRSLRYTPAAEFEGDETFTYTIVDSNGQQDSATVTVHVADPVTGGALPQFSLPGELRQFLIDQAVERHNQQFGLTTYHYRSYPYILEPVYLTAYDATVVDALNATGAGGETRSHSETNTQVEGVDEADIVETDGRYLYTFSHEQLVIADLADLEHPELVAFFDLDDSFTEMYLQGDRITLIDRGSYDDQHMLRAVITVLDVSDRSTPTILERTEMDGHIVDSRAIGDRVYVAVSGIQIPPLEYELIADEKFRVNETLDEYVTRLSDTIIEESLPVYRSYDAAGTLAHSGLLTDPSDIHKPIDPADNSLLSLVTFDAGDDMAGPLSSTGIFTDAAAEVYMAEDSFYVLRNYDGDTAIFKFDVMDDGTSQLVATGKVSGWLLDQFSVDEYEGRLRIATTQVVLETTPQGWTRQLRRFHNLFVLEQQGAELVEVGSIVNLAPTETLTSVRFLGERAYVVTFRVIELRVTDPLFAIDLSDPTQPRVLGALKIPGFSDYLQPVGEDYVIGIGYDANEITGWVGPLQVSLFYVGDLANPTLVDQVTMESAQWATTEASRDHHAVAWFDEYQVLTIPVSWTESTEEDPDGDGVVSWQSGRHSAIWAFEVEVDGTGGGAIEVTGKVKHDGDARRSVRIDGALVTVSENTIKINQLADPEAQISKLHIGLLPTDDTFSVTEDSGANQLDVRANDHVGVAGVVPKIVAASQPVRGGYDFGYYDWYGSNNSEPVGTVEISADGSSLTFKPEENFFGTATFTYTLFDDLRGEQQANVTVQVENVPDDPDAVDDQFVVVPGSDANLLDVLGNDANIDQPSTGPFLQVFATDYVAIDVASPIRTSDFASLGAINTPNFVSDVYWGALVWGNGLTIKAVGEPSDGGTVEIDEYGRGLRYTPADGFIGVETFTYTVETAFGRTDTATVTIYVGLEPPADVETGDPDAESPVAESIFFRLREEVSFAMPVTNSPTVAGSIGGENHDRGESTPRAPVLNLESQAIGRAHMGAAARLERLSLFGELPGTRRQLSDELGHTLATDDFRRGDNDPLDFLFDKDESSERDSDVDLELIEELAVAVAADFRPTF